MATSTIERHSDTLIASTATTTTEAVVGSVPAGTRKVFAEIIGEGRVYASAYVPYIEDVLEQEIALWYGQDRFGWFKFLSTGNIRSALTSLGSEATLNIYFLA